MEQNVIWKNVLFRVQERGVTGPFILYNLKHSTNCLCKNYLSFLKTPIHNWTVYILVYTNTFYLTIKSTLTLRSQHIFKRSIQFVVFKSLKVCKRISSQLMIHKWGVWRMDTMGARLVRTVGSVGFQPLECEGTASH